MLAACASGPAKAPAIQNTAAQAPDAPVSIASGDDVAMVVFVRKFSYEAGAESTSEGVVKCVEKQLRFERPAQRLVSYEEFSRLAFPDMEVASAPHDPEYLRILFDDPTFRARIEPLGIRFVIFVGGVTRSTVKSSSGIVGGSPAGGVLIAYVEWNKATELAASVFDLTNRNPVRQANASASGTPWLLVVEFVPMGATSDTEGNACRGLAQRVASDMAQDRDATPDHVSNTSSGN